MQWVVGRQRKRWGLFAEVDVGVSSFNNERIATIMIAWQIWNEAKIPKKNRKSEKLFEKFE